MCGIVGVVGLGAPVEITDGALTRMRDTLTHRGPDGAGLWRCPWAALAHRRLAVIDPTPAGQQPMLSPDGRYALVYNGELYNDRQVRTELTKLGVTFRTNCDTETVLHALARWGPDAITALRGMFALCFIDRDRKRAVLARDPLGIKPLYAARIPGRGGSRLVFASEPTAILAHPDVSPRPDWQAVSAYLTTIRPTIDHRTMFEGIETLLPGETRVYDTSTDAPPQVLDAWDQQPTTSVTNADQTADVIRDAVRSHLRSDVPMCALLSGGLDSAAITAIANTDAHAGLHTYCAGAKLDGFDDDFTHARAMADALGTTHHEAVIDQDAFAAGWAHIVARTGVPMSTPNEVAILAVARTLRAQGHVVALGGEGADELFGGYAPPMRQAAQHVAALAGRPDTDGGLFQLRSNAWVATDVKPRVLRDTAWARLDHDQGLINTYRDTFNRIRRSAPADSPLQSHLRFHRRMNLPNLLRRLDTATMLASVEGRTPFADIAVARFAEALPMADKFIDTEPPQTKKALRDAFRDQLPEAIVARPKASFPLPFQQWAGAHASVLRTSEFARELFNTEAVQTVSAAPEALWTLAWPMINIAMWGERWWGCGEIEAKPNSRPQSSTTTLHR